MGGDDVVVMSLHQITEASFLNLSMRSDVESTKTPALRVEGSSTFTTLLRGVKSTPVSSTVSTSIGFFFAYS